MKTIQRIGILLLMLVFLFGTIGLSVLRHICNSSNTNTVTVYPEIFKSPGSSCCDDGPAGYACAGRGTSPGNTTPENIDPSPCCKSTTSFLKLEILTLTAGKLVLKDIAVTRPLFTISACRIPSYEQPLLNPAHFQFYSPPLFGIVLVHYLHQMKIPESPSFS